jgi:ribosomal protein S18 acetylase RimI-like enzyme
LINIADLAVLPEHRGKGIRRRLLEAVEGKARQERCCKVTLEVQENNQRARRVYERAGFEQAFYGETTGGSLYYWKNL